jgi:addiction module HigA family antidote
MNDAKQPKETTDASRRDSARGCLAGRWVAQDKLAKLLGVSRRTVSEILHERRPVTTDMAHRLARAFGTSPEMWLGLQQDVDLWDTHPARRKKYERIKRVPASKAA